MWWASLKVWYVTTQDSLVALYLDPSGCVLQESPPQAAVPVAAEAIVQGVGPVQPEALASLLSSFNPEDPELEETLKQSALVCLHVNK